MVNETKPALRPLRLLHHLGQQPNAGLIELVRETGITDIPMDIQPEELDKILFDRWNEVGKYPRPESWNRPPTLHQMELLTALGVIAGKRATTDRFYHGALLLGGSPDKIRRRLHFLVEEYRRGVHFNHVYLMGSNKIHHPGMTEIQLMVAKMKASYIPESWNVTVVACGDVSIGNGHHRHANTTDTFRDLRTQTRIHDIEGGQILVVSNQPSIGYQVGVARCILGPGVQLYVIGRAARPHLPLWLYLDCLAKQFYEELRLYKIYSS